MVKSVSISYAAMLAVLVTGLAGSPAFADYCEASGGLYGEYIEGVEVGEISNVPTGSDGYHDYTDLSTTATIETGYSITVTTGNPSSGDQCGIWVDWNQDEDFDGASEQITTSGGPFVFTATITPPAGAVLGDTRMRIRIMWTGTLSPCGATDYGEVEDYTLSVASDGGGYCEASGGGMEYIQGVEVGDISNIPTGSSGYADYTELSTPMALEAGYSITVTTGNPSGGDQCGIWVDWNQNEDFDDAGEQITTIGGPDAFTATITPPAGAQLGDTRMRIRIKWSDSLNACGATTYGEVEDYTITVVSGGSGYCEASGGCGERISGVEVGTISNTGTSCDGYADYTELSTEMEIEARYPIIVTNDNPFPGDKCRIWVDWNQDEDFYDIGEQIGTSGGPSSFAALIRPPASALLGDTRMRVRIAATGPLEPCGDTTFGEVEDYTITVVPAVGGYCEASGGGTEYIQGVEVGDISNIPTGSDGYADYTETSTTMEIGTGYPITVTNGTPYAGDQCCIWIDWNQDEDFYDVREQIYTTDGPDEFEAVITPPATAVSGDTRMRVRIASDGPLGSCGDTTFGEVEDYTITVVPLLGDLVYSDGVDMRDFAVLAAQWQQAPGEPSADIAPDGGDGIVDWLDLAVQVEDWLVGVE